MNFLKNINSSQNFLCVGELLYIVANVTEKKENIKGTTDSKHPASHHLRRASAEPLGNCKRSMYTRTSEETQNREIGIDSRCGGASSGQALAGCFHGFPLCFLSPGGCLTGSSEQERIRTAKPVFRCSAPCKGRYVVWFCDGLAFNGAVADPSGCIPV